jgi:hypothetical protein
VAASGSAIQHLDVESVVKASQALSSEIELPELAGTHQHRSSPSPTPVDDRPCRYLCSRAWLLRLRSEGKVQEAGDGLAASNHEAPAKEERRDQT